MSRIPKLPSSTSKENRPVSTNVRSFSRIMGGGLSDIEKKKLLTNHTKPLSRVMSTASTATYDVVPAPRTKRAATAPSVAGPIPKSHKVEKKTVQATAKIPPYDYKARYNALLEKHKSFKIEYTDMKEKYADINEEIDRLKEIVESSVKERDMVKEKLLNTLKDLSQKKLDFDRLKLEFDIQKHELTDLQDKTRILEDVTKSLKEIESDHDQLKIKHEVLLRKYKNLDEENEALKVQTAQLKQISAEYDILIVEHKDSIETIAKTKNDTDALQNILASIYRDQRILRNTIQDLKGNIRVYCRVRPPLESEAKRTLYNLNALDDCSIEVEKIELVNSARKGKHSFTFDGIFRPNSSQEDVFAEVSPMVQSALDGYNVCIFAYGQTGSGKTYTMEGGSDLEQYGIIPRAINMIFTCMEDLKRMGWELTIKASFLEIYNEVIYDLLDSKKDQDSHDIKMVDSKGSDIYVSNLKEEAVKCTDDFIKFLISAQRNRQTAATLNNERSSRSHSVAKIKISAVNEKRKEKFTSNLNLVDLAGSESGKTTLRMDETKHINRSLSELANVILSLQTNQSHIPYRNSKLTHLLMPSLGGNSKTLMLVNINQFNEGFNETLNSLRFATQVNSVKTGKAKKNITTVD